MHDGGGSALAVVTYQGRGGILIFISRRTLFFPCCSMSSRVPKINYVIYLCDDGGFFLLGWHHGPDSKVKKGSMILFWD